MAYSRRDGFSYLDGVQVKISEKFRPPRRVVLPVSLARNTFPETLNEHYDFSVELRAVEFAERYRREQQAKRQARVDRVAADIEQFTQVGTSPSDGSIPIVATATTANDCSARPVAPPVVVPSGAILLPAQATGSRETKEAASTAPARPQTNQHFSLAEFENDSSSPFDYVELQTINDLEELNSVFQGISVCHPAAPKSENADSSAPAASQVPTFDVKIPGVPVLQEAEVNGYLDGTAASATAAAEDAKPLRPSRSASDVRSSGDKGLQNAWRSNTPPPPYTHSNVPHLPSMMDARPKRILSPATEQLLKYLVDMGFEEDRALRAIESQGMDDKKVIEHLCHVQSLVDAGFTDLDSEEALGLNKSNYEQALEFLKLQKQFLDLGFQREAVTKALMENKNDRDKALDSLLG
ncbi:ubiquitin-associated protein 1 isoform X2 [Ixodes scapularis]|uniref:ubiquitin-associated protein 1 isoform X2 n=1 Tax=Ixodes scapularis TaxID=6945 RepID=UPI001A9D0C23|nr:ubiquitin-associated protein 1 isoform X2 [Ixodes scapularis]XP_029835754.2 ubiquitin-associated protein 1 isoform X2 [Ixodes scapularis]XP_040061131.1 ubiquitin-associated protein 1 isoform X2 [Ixodes scapularis]